MVPAHFSILFLLTDNNTRQGTGQVLSMLKDLRTAVDRLAQRVDCVESSMRTIAAAASALFPQGKFAVRQWGQEWSEMRWDWVL
jgi:hypothetical protein